MKTVTCAVLFVICLLGEPLAPGVFKGRYEGSAGASGDFRVKLEKSGAGEWKAEVGFALAGEDVKCKVTSVQVNGAKLKIVYQFDLQGTALESMIDGELDNAKLSGKYRTQLAGDGQTVDEGTWSTASSVN